MGLFDDELDQLITNGLQQPAVTPQQKQRAWEALEARLTGQIEQPAAERAPAAHVRLRARVTQAGHTIWLTVRTFVLEENRYQQAHRDRHALRYSSFATVPAPFSFELVGPLRPSNMGQVC